MKQYIRKLFAYIAEKLGYQDVLYPPLGPMVVIHKQFDTNELRYTVRVTPLTSEREIRNELVNLMSDSIADCIYLDYRRTNHFEGTCTGRLWICKERIH
jgi:hypothetical protein